VGIRAGPRCGRPLRLADRSSRRHRLRRLAVILLEPTSGSGGRTAGANCRRATRRHRSAKNSSDSQGRDGSCLNRCEGFAGTTPLGEAQGLCFGRSLNRMKSPRTVGIHLFARDLVLHS
jgi:hypothetical protein